MRRVLSKWKELLVFVFMFMIVMLLSVCRDDKPTYLGRDVSAVCKNKSTLMFTLGAVIVGFIIMKGIDKKLKKAKSSKKDLYK